MVLVPHSTRYCQHRRAAPAVHHFGRVDNIHGQARQNLPVDGQTRRSGPLVYTGLKYTLIFSPTLNFYSLFTCGTKMKFCETFKQELSKN
ncbi:hypothetical protein E2C01_017275 [Portunus trituberculatus]|uniref:Uncharacterized protein n=1 Tax=Portunus trituberculatus TaxID=210409 RepID=A0A5B7DT12_PORTR|nr:hypothetical protein [Portunus trituberculatus]